MQAILLAAGQSTRLQPISDKNLLEFCGKPLIQHRAESLLKAGIEKIVIVGNKHNLNQLNELFGNNDKITIAEQGELNNSQADGVLAGTEKIEGDQVLIMSTNDVFEDQLIQSVLSEVNDEVDGVVVGKQVNEYFPGGYLSVDSQGWLTDIIEKPGPGNEPSDMVNMVLHAFNDFSKFIKHLKSTEGQNDGRYEMALDEYIKQGGAKIKTLKYNGFWQPIKYPWHIILVMNWFLENLEKSISPDAHIAETAIIRGNVVVEAGAKILDHVVIQGPAYIGQNTMIANNSLVRSSMIGKNCVAGYTTEVARSYLNHDIWMHTNYVGDSIIDSNVSFGSGTVLGNLRFDEENIKVKIKDERIDSGTNKLGAIIGSGVRFGINASTSPGVKIGQNTFIGAGVLVEKDVDGGKMVLLDQTLKITDNTKSVDVNKRS